MAIEVAHVELTPTPDLVARRIEATSRRGDLLVVRIGVFHLHVQNRGGRGGVSLGLRDVQVKHEVPRA